MAITKDIKRRIKSIGSTKKVTKAMEMVSAAKMRKAVANVLSSRSYANLAWELVRNLATKTESQLHPLLEHSPEIKKVAIVLITSNRGLCGGFNSQIIQKTIHYIKEQQNKNCQVDLIILGKKGGDFTAKRGFNIIAQFEKLDITTSVMEISPLAKLLITDFIEKKYDRVALAYSDFISTLVQKPRILELLPIIDEVRDKDLGEIKQPITDNLSPNLLKTSFEYIFEPTPDEVLSELLPRLIEMQIYQAILESDASEHSARMVAMRNASDAALEMIDDLTLVFNKARQSSITAELADISGGRAALE